MTAFRVGLVTVYAFLITLAVVLIAHTWSRVTNPYFGTRITNMPAWFELGMYWFLLALAIAGAVASVLSCLGLAQRRSWVRSLVLTIAWLTLLFYVAPDV